MALQPSGSGRFLRLSDHNLGTFPGLELLSEKDKENTHSGLRTYVVRSSGSRLVLSTFVHVTEETMFAYVLTLRKCCHRVRSSENHLGHISLTVAISSKLVIVELCNLSLRNIPRTPTYISSTRNLPDCISFSV